MNESDLKDTKLGEAVFTGARLNGCDLRGADLYGAELTNTTWRKCKVDSKTVLRATIWLPDHDALNDGADELALPLYRKFLNWETIRVLGRIPLFSGAYALLAVALFVGTGIVWANDWIIESEIVPTAGAALPFPPRLLTLLIGSAALAVGATVFEFACPPRVKEFSRTGWVEDLRRPGLLYSVEALQRPYWNGIALTLTLAGALLVGGIFGERLVRTVFLVLAAT